MAYSNINTYGSSFKRLKALEILGIPYGPDLPTDLTAEDGLCLFVHTDEDFNNGVWKWWDGSQWIDLNDPDRYGEATSDPMAPNDYQVTFSPPMNVYNEGSVLKIKFPTANTGTATLESGTLPTREIVLPGGAPLSGGELKAGGIYFLFVTDTKVQLIGGAGGSSGGGDMTKSVYDPTGINADAFDWNNFTNKPTIPSAQVNSDWSAVGGVAEILNKPTIPTIDPNTTIQGNDFNGVNQLVKLDGDGKLPAVDGSLLYNVPAGLPSMAGNAGKFLKTDGTAALWTPAAIWALSGGDAYYNTGKVIIGGTNYINETFTNPPNTKMQIQGDVSIVHPSITGNFLSISADMTNLFRMRVEGNFDSTLLSINTSNGQITLGRSAAGVILNGSSRCNNAFTSAGLSSASSSAYVGPAGSLCLSSNAAGNAYINFNELSVDWKMSIGVRPAGDLLFLKSNHPTNFSGTELMKLVRDTGNLLIGTSTDIASSILTLSSTTKGFLPPRMNATQAETISAPAEGLLVYVNDVTTPGSTITTKGWWGYSGSTWVKLN